MTTEGTNPHAGVNIPEVIFVGRFWVTAEGDTAAFLPADKNVALEHERRNVLEADGRDMQRQSIFLCQLIHHLRGRKRLDDLAAHPEVSGEIAQEDGKNLVGINELARAVDRADAIRVAVGGEARIVPPGNHRGAELSYVWLDGLRIEAREERV